MDWQKRQTSFEQLAAWRGLASNLTGVEQPRRLMSRQMTWNMLSVLGVTPVVGRDFTADDDQSRRARTAIVSYAFWQRELGGTPAAIGRQLIIDETPVTVIGVLPKEFTIARAEDLFLPFGNFLDGSVPMFFGRGNHFGLAAIGRLKDGVSVDAAERRTEGDRAAARTGISGDQQRQQRHGAAAFEVLVSDARPMLYVLLGAVVTMLLDRVREPRQPDAVAGRGTRAGNGRPPIARRGAMANRPADAHRKHAARRHGRHRRRRAGVCRFRSDRRAAAAEPAAHSHHHDRSARPGDRGRVSIGTGLLFGLMPACRPLPGAR